MSWSCSHASALVKITFQLLIPIRLVLEFLSHTSDGLTRSRKMRELAQPPRQTLRLLVQYSTNSEFNLSTKAPTIFDDLKEYQAWKSRPDIHRKIVLLQSPRHLTFDECYKFHKILDLSKLSRAWPAFQPQKARDFCKTMRDYNL